MDRVDPYDASDTSLTEHIGFTYKKRISSSTQDHCSISSDPSTRLERNAFVDYFDKNGEETQKNNWRSSVSSESGR